MKNSPVKGGVFLYVRDHDLSGEHNMTIIGAAMRKLLCLAVGILKSGVPFDPNYPSAAASLSKATDHCRA
jgi:hypothetical protein